MNSTSHRLRKIANTLKEMRFSEGRNQDELSDWGATRRQIQRGEQGFNLTLASLFNLLDCYGYRLDEFFEGME
jgi:transcriptional regulator with XRE-family HTH domain